MITGVSIDSNSDEGDSDYIYTIINMAELPGKAFQKKRNHVSRFLRTYGQNWSFTLYDGAKNSIPDANSLLQIYSQWKVLRTAQGDSSQTSSDFLNSEEQSINQALNPDNFKKLGLVAGVLSINSKAQSFIIASFTTPDCLNAHFEKCSPEHTSSGALALLNQQFAKAIQKNYPYCTYLNREEDLNIPGLKQSKLSYNPDFLIKKYFCQISLN